MSLSEPLFQMPTLFHNSESQRSRSKHSAASQCIYWYRMFSAGTPGAVFGDLSVPLGIARHLDGIYSHPS